MAKRGPRTYAGRRKVALNALSHGVLARTPVIPGIEADAEWDRHLNGFQESLAPANDFEAFLVERIAQTAWRLRRLEIYENEMLTLAQASAEELAAARILYPAGGAISLHGLTPAALIQARIDRLQAVADLLLTLQAGTRPRGSYTREEIELLYEGLAGALSPDAPETFQTRIIREVATETTDEQAKARDLVTNVQRLLRELEPVMSPEFTLGRDPGDPPEPPPLPPSLIARYPIDLVLVRLLPEVRRLESELLDLDTTIARIRRESLLLDAPDLAKITRYEAHLRRQFTQYLHELEARQAQRRGRPSPLARLDVHLLDTPLP